jgi:hypothetical protein
MAMLIGDAITACKLEQEAPLVERVKSLAAKLESAIAANAAASTGGSDQLQTPGAPLTQRE